MIIIKQDVPNRISLTNEKGEYLAVLWDSDHNYWFETKGEEVTLSIEGGISEDRDLFAYLWLFIKSAIGSYYLYRDGREDNKCPDFFKSDGEKKIITVHSDPIDYKGQKYEGATLRIEYQVYQPMIVKLSGSIITQDKTFLRIDPDNPGPPCYNDVVELFQDLRRHCENERKWREQRENRETK